MLELHDVRIGYGDLQVVHGIDLVVPDGAIVALLGPNGAGKTTTLQAISGLLPVAGGKIVLDGQDVTTASAQARSRQGMGMVPEGRGIFRHLSVRENLLLQCGPMSLDDGLDLVRGPFPRLIERLDQQAGTLSGGEQQMLALARTYVSRPRLALLDEVSIGLAPLIVDEIFEFLGLLARDGASMLIVEQYVARALDLADLVYVLSQGEIVFAGDAGEVDHEQLAGAYLHGDMNAALAG